MSGTGSMHPEEHPLAAMNEIARIASGDLELRPMLARVSEALYRHFGWEFITFVSIDPVHDRYVCEAVRSDKPTVVKPGYSHGLDRGVVGEVASSGEPVILDDVRLARDYIEAMPGARSEVCVPIRYRDRVIAALNIESTKPADFRGQLPMLETIAEQVAGAIESARMYEALMEHATLSEVMSEVSRIALEPLALDKLLQQIVDYIAAHFPVFVPGILLLDETGRNFTLEADTGTRLRQPLKEGEWTIDMGVCGRCVRLGEPVLVEDVEQDPDYLAGAQGMRAEFVTPIRYRGRVLGVLNLESAHPRSFTPNAQKMLTGIAEQIAGAIEGARLDAALREHTHTIEILNRVSHLATQSADLQLQLRRITDFLAAELSVAVASILVLDETSTRFIIETMSGDLPLGVPGDGEWSIETGICGRCVRTGEPQLVYADSGDPDYVEGHPDIRSEYVVPIRYNARILGLLNLESTRRDSFTPQMQNLCRAVADQVAGAIHIAIVNRNLSETNRVVEERTRELAEANEKLKRANLELHRISSYDALTGIPNRRRLDEVLVHEWRWAQRTGRPLAFMLADLDHFKKLNDSHGHLRGDECLRLVAQALADGLMRPADLVARYGGEEFALVLPDLSLAEAQSYAESLRARVEALRLAHGSSPASPYVTLSIGVATMLADRRREPAELVALADAALYTAKKTGRNRVAMSVPTER